MRCICKNPKLIIADEPTANLDEKNCEQLMKLIVKLNKDYRMAFLIATHDKRFKKVSTLKYELGIPLVKNHQERISLFQISTINTVLISFFIFLSIKTYIYFGFSYNYNFQMQFYQLFYIKLQILKDSFI